MILPAPKFHSIKDIKIELDKIPCLGYNFLSLDKKLYTHT